MTICAIKVCRNYKGRLKTTKNVTYHRIPNDPMLRIKWIDMIRKSRGEDLWQPAKTTVICSDHFSAKDLYVVNNQKRRRLRKKAIPRKALFLSSVESDTSDDEVNDSVEDRETISEPAKHVLSDEAFLLTTVKTENSDDEVNDSVEDIETISEQAKHVLSDEALLFTTVKTENSDDEVNDSVEDTETISEQAKHVLSDEALLLTTVKTENSDDEVNDSVKHTETISEQGKHVLSDEVCSDLHEKQSSGVTIYTHVAKCLTSASSSIPEQATGAKIGDERRPESEGETIEDFSDLDSIYDTPSESKMRQELRRRTKLQKKHTLKIQSLRRKNLRLNKKIASLKQIISTLKKDQYNNHDTHDSSNDSSYDSSHDS